MTNKKQEKVAFILILCLLAVFLPLTGYSMYLKSTNANEKLPKENKNKNFFYDGKLWFYKENGELLGTYTCLNTYCDYGSSYENDKEYAIDFYKSEEEVFLPMINEQYVFLKDTEEENSTEVFLYDIKNKIAFKEASYASLKNYQIGIEGNNFIVENKEHQFGILQIKDMAVLTIPYSYEFLGLINEKNEEEKILSDYFIALQNDEWMIIDQNEAKMTKNIQNPIVTFNGEYVITKDSTNNYYVVDYENNPIIQTGFKKLWFVDKYLACLSSNEFYLYDFVTGSEVSQVHSVTGNKDVETEVKENNTIEIKINNRTAETVKIE